MENHTAFIRGKGIMKARRARKQKFELVRPDGPPPASVPMDLVVRLGTEEVGGNGFVRAIFSFTHCADRDIIVNGARVLESRFCRKFDDLGALAAQLGDNGPCWIVEIFRAQLLHELVYANKPRHAVLAAYALGHLHGCPSCRQFLLGDHAKTDQVRRLFPKEYFTGAGERKLVAVR